jgi:hypothetical protein
MGIRSRGEVGQAGVSARLVEVSASVKRGTDTSVPIGERWRRG